MGHNNNWTRLFKGTGISLGEINSVLQAGMNHPDLGTLCKHNNINIWAKYKPFRNSSIAFANASAWLTAATTARFGFGSAETDLSYGWNSSSPEWDIAYLKPRGGTYNELYRQLDFVDLTTSSEYGYDHNAVAPIAIEFDPATGLYQNGSGVRIKLNANANASWNGNTCVSFRDIMPASLSNYKFAVLLKYKPSWSNVTTNNLIVSKYGPSSSEVSGNYTVNIPFAGIESNDYIYSPLMGEVLSEGNSVTAVACLVNVTWQPTQEDQNAQWGYCYKYSTDPNEPEKYQANVVSLNIADGIDMKNLIFHETDSIRGIKGSISNLNAYKVQSASFGRDGIIRIDGITISLNTTECDINTWGSLDEVYVQLFITFGPAQAATDNMYVCESQSSSSSDIKLTAIGDISGSGYEAYFTPPYPDTSERYRIVNVDSGVTYDDVSVSIGWNQTASKTVNGANLQRRYIRYDKSSGASQHTITVHGFVYMGELNTPGYKVMLTPATVDMDSL